MQIKIGQANEILNSATDAENAAKLPTIEAAEGLWVLITPKGVPFTAQTLQLHHIRMLLKTLKLVHSANVFHRDVRFSNIFMLENDGVLLNDWGSSVQGGVAQLVAGCPEPWCHSDLAGVSECILQAKHYLFSLVATAANLLLPGASEHGRRQLLREAFLAAESADYDGIANGFKRVVWPE